MDKLVAVEFNPSTHKTFRSHPFIGCVGETLISFYSRAKNPDRKQPNLPVRFPLLAPNARIGTCMNDRDPLDPLQLLEEGLWLPMEDIFLSDKTPVSLFIRKKASANTTITEIKSLFESKYYLATYSNKCFFKLLNLLAETFSYGWAWKREWAPNLGTHNIFIEARLYGIDVVINTYDSNNFGGIALEVITRPCNEGSPRIRYRCDTYLISSYSEYISYIDGITIPCEQLSSPWYSTLKQIYKHVATPKELVKTQKTSTAAFNVF